MNISILGLALDLIGVFIITLTAILNPRHQRIYGQPLRKTYWWNSWRPLYKNTKTLKWKIQLNRKPIVYGMFPPKYKLHISGFLFILIGFLFQLSVYLS